MPTMIQTGTCSRCGGTGYIAHADTYGDYESFAYCDCDAGYEAKDRDGAELDAIQHAAMIEAAEFWASHADPGPEPDNMMDADLDAPPF